jgi:hypothetical protein
MFLQERVTVCDLTLAQTCNASTVKKRAVSFIALQILVMRGWFTEALMQMDKGRCPRVLRTTLIFIP